MRLPDFKKLAGSGGMYRGSGGYIVTDWCSADGTPVVVTYYIDRDAKRSYQVDETGMRYRQADFSRGPAMYGEWLPVEH